MTVNRDLGGVPNGTPDAGEPAPLLNTPDESVPNGTPASSWLSTDASEIAAERQHAEYLGKPVYVYRPVAVAAAPFASWERVG
ncbi:MAG: hypothetical protein ACREX9_23175 [Gammaproteobacteria bacterium]